MSNNLGTKPFAADPASPQIAIQNAVDRHDAALTEQLVIDLSQGDHQVTAEQYRGHIVFQIANATVPGRIVTLPAIRRFVITRLDASNTVPVGLAVGATIETLQPATMAIVHTDGTADGLSLATVAPVPLGGDGGDVLTKLSGGDFDYGWAPATGEGGSSTFTGLTDVPPSYAGYANQLLRVAGDETGLEFHAPNPVISAFTGLSDTPNGYTGQGGKFVKVSPAADGLEFVSGSGGGAASFTDLGDVPSSYLGNSLKALRVRAAEDGLEFYTPASGGAGGGFEETGTPPTVAAFATTLNSSGSLSAQDTAWGVEFRVTPSATMQDRVDGILAACPSSTWRATARVTRGWYLRGFLTAGLLLRESATGKLVTFYTGHHNSGIGVAKYNSGTSFNSILFEVAEERNMAMWLRASYDGTLPNNHYSFEFSIDGRTWAVFAAMDKTTFFATDADQVGLFVNSVTSSTPLLEVRVGFQHWELLDLS